MPGPVDDRKPVEGAEASARLGDDLDDAFPHRDRNGEPVEQRERSDLFSVYEQALLDSDERFRRLVAAAPPAEQVATLRMLTARDFGAYRAPTRDLILAMLLEAAGEKAEALQLWRELGAALGPDGPVLQRTRVAGAIRRLSPAQ